MKCNHKNKYSVGADTYCEDCGQDINELIKIEKNAEISREKLLKLHIKKCKRQEQK